MLQSRSWLLSPLGLRPLFVRCSNHSSAASPCSGASMFASPSRLASHSPDLVGWAQEVDMCLCGDIPSNEHHRVRIIDFLYHRMVSILSWHIPHQHCSRHRCQPSWWSPECLAMLPAIRFRVARMAFHRTVIVSLLQWFVELFPLPAGWIMRLVSCGSLPPTSRWPADVSAANWRQHFSSVGAPSQCFDDEFFEEVSQGQTTSLLCPHWCQQN